VPEPGMLSFFGLAGVVAALWFRRSSKAQVRAAT
jgi:hypothetical protein